MKCPLAATRRPWTVSASGRTLQAATFTWPRGDCGHREDGWGSRAAVTGDLARRKVLPGLYHLDRAGLLPAGYRIVGTSRRPLSDEAFRAHARAAVVEFGRGELDPAAWDAFAAGLSYASSDAADVSALADAVDRAKGQIGGSPRLLHYLSVPPVAFAGIVEALGANDLTDAQLEIFLAVVHIDHVQIDVPETLSIGSRAGFYEGTGAFRDMIVTHLLQVVGFVAMEPPTSTAPQELVARKIDVFRALRPLDPTAGRARPVRRLSRRGGRRRRLADRDVRRS